MIWIMFGLRKIFKLSFLIKTMKIYLIRHGHYLPEWNSKDGFLTEKGKKQIENLGLRFLKEKVNFKKIYSSPKIRARESAQECCKILGIENIIYSEGLIEINGIENEKDVAKRMENFIEDISCEFEKDSFGIFSHCYAIKYLLNSFDFDSYRNVLPHAGVTLLDYSGKKIKILEYNPDKHLKGIESY